VSVHYFTVAQVLYQNCMDVHNLFYKEHIRFVMDFLIFFKLKILIDWFNTCWC